MNLATSGVEPILPEPAEMVLNASVVDREELHDDLAIVKVRPDSGLVPRFEPGQYATLGLPLPPDPEKPTRDGKPKLLRRAYSIASSPGARTHLEFYITLVSEGRLTPRLWSMRTGARLFLDPKIRGNFTLEPVPHDSDLIMVATGTGLAPFMSMLRAYSGMPHWRRCIVLHGVRASADLGYRDELLRRVREDPTIQYIPAVSREPEGTDYDGYHGRVTELLEPERFKEMTGEPLDCERCHVFLCGNPAMIDAVQQDLEGRGFKTHSRKEPGNLHFERYW